MHGSLRKTDNNDTEKNSRPGSSSTSFERLIGSKYGDGNGSNSPHLTDFSRYRRPSRVLGLPARPQSGKLTRCYRTKPRQPSLSEKKIFRVLGICVCIVIFAISHLHLRFAISDAKVEFRELQRQKALLETTASRLEHEVTQLSDLGKLQQRAVDDFGLVQDDGPVRNLAVIPPELVAHYSETPVAVPVRANQHEMQEGEDVEKLTALERVFEKVMDGSWAVAMPER